MQCSKYNGCCYEQSGERYYCAQHNLTHICNDQCDQRFVNHDCTSTCKISGRCFNQIIASHPFERVQSFVDVVPHVNLPPPRRKRRNPFKQHLADARRTASDIIETLLYGRRRNELIRTRLSNIKKKFNATLKRLQRKQNALTQRRKQRLLAAYLEESHVVPIKHKDEQRILDYTDKVIEQWVKLSKTEYGHAHRSHLHLPAHVLGCLYLMQYGIEENGIEQDDYLLAMLPPIHDLRKLGFRTKDVTRGKNHLLGSFTHSTSRMHPSSAQLGRSPT